MFKNIVVVSLVIALIHTACLPYLQAQSSTPQKAFEFKEKAAKWGVGKKVTVKMIDGNTYKGALSQVTDEGVVVSDVARGREVSASYSGMKSVSAGHSKLFKTLVALGVVIAIAGIACGASKDQCGDSR